MIVTVGGSAGSGKSTLARDVAERLGFKHVSAGEIMREMAREKGMSLLEFSAYAEGNHDVDREIDERQKKIVSSPRDFVVDGRLSAFFIDPDFRVWLTAPLEVRAKRILGRDKNEFKTLEEAREGIKSREASERKRYKEIYGIDLGDLSNYHLVLDTSRWDAGKTADIVVLAIEKLLNK